MLRPHRLFAVALLAALAAACSKKKEAAPAAPPFQMRDLAAATALDARLARVTLLAGDVQAALAPAPAAAPAAAPAKPPTLPSAYLGTLDVALADAEQAFMNVTHPIDRLPAHAALGAAREYAGKLAAAARAPAEGSQAELLAARDRLGAAIAGYRGARAGYRLDAPEPQGAEREFAEARRDMERTEAAFASRTRVAPREEGHEFDPAAARMTALMAAERAKKLAGELPPGLQTSAARYAAAEAQALEAITSLAQAAEAERAAVSRRYHAAKAEALAALADYFAALATR